MSKDRKCLTTTRNQSDLSNNNLELMKLSGLKLIKMIHKYTCLEK